MSGFSVPAGRAAHLAVDPDDEFRAQLFGLP